MSRGWKKWGKDFTLNAVSFGFYSTAKKTSKEFGRFARKNNYVAEITTIAGCIVTAAAGPAGCSAVTAAVTYSVSDGDLRASVKADAVAYASAAASGQVSGYLQGQASITFGHQVGAVLAHGVIGGLSAAAQGGDVQSGFLVGAAGKSFNFAVSGFSGSGALFERGADGFVNASIDAVAARIAITAIVGGQLTYPPNLLRLSAPHPVIFFLLRSKICCSFSSKL